ncbi:MAG: putative endonuclease [Halopseudomonas sp.]|jgi:putative endonuclease|uniref:GIY-YIG nuclease family protein n=1 Tax=Halopseudomonas sp. TaxID=2901191 RepID=UPI0039E5F416
MPVDTPESSPAPEAVRIWWVYMVRAENGYLYTGISTDPARRFVQHQQGKGARFFNRSPAQALVWTEVCHGHTDALRREIVIKALGKTAKEQLISQANVASFVPKSDFAASCAPVKLSHP